MWQQSRGRRAFVLFSMTRQTFKKGNFWIWRSLKDVFIMIATTGLEQWGIKLKSNPLSVKTVEFSRKSPTKKEEKSRTPPAVLPYYCTPRVPYSTRSLQPKGLQLDALSWRSLTSQLFEVSGRFWSEGNVRKFSGITIRICRKHSTYLKKGVKSGRANPTA